MVSNNCCFLTYIQVSQKAGQVVWYSNLFQNFPQFAVAHTVKGFGIVNKAELDFFFFFWNYLAFTMIQWMLAIWFLVPLPFLHSTSVSGSSQFTYCWSLAWRILSITLIACEMSIIVQSFVHSLALPVWYWNENWLFPVLWPWLSFTNLLAYWVQHFNYIIF